MRKITRRLMLQLAGGLGLALGLQPKVMASASPRLELDPDARRTLTSYFDTLIPNDGASPGAIKTGIDQRLASLAEANESLRKWVEEVCRWLDGEARNLGTGARAFSDLGENHRNTVLERAESLPPQSSVRRFFETTRSLAFSAYYGKAASWPAIGYAGPPQPHGFPDYAQPPAAGR